MNKNISKKIIVLFSLSFLLLNNHFVVAEDIVPITPPIRTPAVVDSIITPDITPPVISLIGDANISINVGDVYKDSGATALDDTDGDITSSIVVVNNVDITKAGTYTVTYDVEDKAPNSASQVIRTVIVKNVVIAPKLKEQVIIRDGNTIVYNGYYDLPDTGTINIPDKNNVEHSIDKRSVLAVLYDIDQVNDDFSISNLDYNSGFGSLYMKCLTPKNARELCDNWQYVVNDTYPSFGMDKDILTGNEKIYIYFGPQNKVILSSNSITTEDKLKVTAEKYDYANNAWVVRTGVTVGVTSPDPNNPWSPNDDIKSLVDGATGEAQFSSIPAGDYNVGVKEDYYWPTESLTVGMAPVVVSGGGSTPIVLETDKTFSIVKALEFLSKNEQSNGSFGNDMYTDWVAIGATAGGNSSIKNNIANYLENNYFNSSTLTDNERHAMALMSLNINPYTGTPVNYIKKITDNFDGTQFGDVALYNDDIFALIVLKNAGYDYSDEIIEKDIHYLISKQVDGSWGSADITAAALQSLRGFENTPGVSDAIRKGELYLISNQGVDGGFGNSFSTSWILQSLYRNNQILKAENYLADLQQADGGLESPTTDLNTRIWSTAYAISAILHKPWSQILNNFSKPEIVVVPGAPILTEPEIQLKKDIIEPIVVSQIEKVNLKLGQVKAVDKIEKNILPKNRIIKTMHKTEGNQLLASVNSVASINKENHFLSFLSIFINKLKAPFIWLWQHVFV